MKIRITARVLRTVDKCGGLDEYLLGEKAARIKELGMGGWKLRWRIMQTEKVRERFRVERERLGLPPKEEVLVGSHGNLVSKEQVEEEVRSFDEDLERGADVDIGEDVAEVVGGSEFMQEKPASKDRKVLL